MTSASMKQWLATLASASRHDFERALVPFLNVIWPGVVRSPTLGSWDRRGADHLAWEGDRLHVVVQAKGFEVATPGEEQFTQCLKSIESFRAAGERTEHYALVHNRLHQGLSGWAAVQAALDSLRADGLAGATYLWDRREVVSRATEAARTRMLSILKRRAAVHTRRIALMEPAAVAPESRVPVRWVHLVASTHRLVAEATQGEGVVDPVSLLREAKPYRTTILVGQAGFGKSTALARLARESDRTIALVDAASVLPANGNNLAALLRESEFVDEALADAPETDLPLLTDLALTALRGALQGREAGASMLLIIDGLDESRAFAGSSGIAALFNLLHKLSVPVIVSLRTEMWDARRREFESAAHITEADGEPQLYHHLRLIELAQWTDECILAYATRFSAALDDEARARVVAFQRLVATEGFDHTFGDIPRRPLFLGFLLDAVAAGGVTPQSRAALVESWVVRKVERDVLGAVRGGGPGRTPLHPDLDGVDETVVLALELMEAAAEQMTARTDGRIELTSSARLADVRSSSARLSDVSDRLAVALHTLLVPTDSRAHRDELRFAHRVLQEFFLARAAIRRPDAWPVEHLPEPVRHWVRDIRLSGEAGV